MEIKEKLEDFFDSLKDRVSQTFETFKDMAEKNPRNAILIFASAFIFLICILLVLLLANSSRKEKIVLPDTITFSEEILIPPSETENDKYILSRETKPKWQDDEIENWFTNPGDKELEDLSNTNRKYVRDIFEVAP